MPALPDSPPAQSLRRHTEQADQGLGHRIGIFDSGLGGLSVLRAIRTRLPLVQIVYVADSGHAPYGERDQAYITGRCRHIAAFLKTQAVDCIVVACNTATAIAVNSLRAELPAHLPLVGVEPGVKPAVHQSTNKRIGVLATPGTLASARFNQLVASHAQGVQLIRQPCPGLAKEIEMGDLNGPTIDDLVERFSKPLRDAGVDTVVLGCTHYPFVAHVFQKALGPHVRIIDTAEAVARQTAKVLEHLSQSASHQAHADGPSISLWTSGDPAHLSLLTSRWLHIISQAQPLP